MDCKELELMLDLIIDGEISQEEKEKALSHIEGCEKCKKEYEKAVEYYGSRERRFGKTSEQIKLENSINQE